MATRQKLELTWIGKDQRPRLEPRILLEDPARSYHASTRVTDNDLFDNQLIKGDNLLALKSLEAEFSGKVKCVFIDPPHSTGSAFTHYDDGLEHSIWLGLMRDRLEIIRRLLADDGSLWITIDDNEAHYLKVMCDEVFGRANFIASSVWQKRYARDNNSAFGSAHDYVFLYARSPEAFKRVRNKLNADDKTKSAYRNPNYDPRGPWQSISFTGAGFRPNQMYRIEGPRGQSHYPPEGRHWATLEPEYFRLEKEGRFWFGQDGNGVPRLIRYLDEVGGLVPSTWWPHEKVGHNDEGKKRRFMLFSEKRVLSIRQSQSVFFSESFTSPPTPATSSSIPSPAPAPPARWPTRWVTAGSWWSWVSIATRTSCRACKR
jgi:adenine-specific DNA-methyltransferase